MADGVETGLSKTSKQMEHWNCFSERKLPGYSIVMHEFRKWSEVEEGKEYTELRQTKRGEWVGGERSTGKSNK